MRYARTRKRLPALAPRSTAFAPFYDVSSSFVAGTTGPHTEPRYTAPGIHKRSRGEAVCLTELEQTPSLVEYLLSISYPLDTCGLFSLFYELLVPRFDDHPKYFNVKTAHTCAVSMNTPCLSYFFCDMAIMTGRVVCMARSFCVERHR